MKTVALTVRNSREQESISAGEIQNGLVHFYQKIKLKNIGLLAWSTKIQDVYSKCLQGDDLRVNLGRAG